MPVPIIVEDGSAKPDANSYISLADANTFFDTHLYPEAWSGALDDDRRTVALIHATRMIDSYFNFYGYRTTNTQALSFPRRNVKNTERDMRIAGDEIAALVGVDALSRPIYYIGVEFIPPNVVPTAIIAATCEMSRLMLARNREADPPTAGIRSMNLGAGALQFTFDPADRPQIFTPTVLLLLRPFGRYRGEKQSFVPLIRV